MYLNPSHNHETPAYHIYNSGTNLKDCPCYSQAHLSVQTQPHAVLTYSTFLLFSSLFWEATNQSQESEMQWQLDRVTGTSVYMGTKDSVQGLRDYPVIQTSRVFPPHRSNMDLSPKGKQEDRVEEGTTEQCPCALTALVEAD